MTTLIKVGKWHYNSQSGELSHKGRTIRLPNQQHALLSLLIQNGNGSLTTRESIIAELWPQGRVVEYDQSLNACMRKLRRALEDDSQNPEYIETIAGKGYRFVAAVSTPPSKSIHPFYLVIGLCIILLAGLFWSLTNKKETLFEPPTLAVMPIVYLHNEGSVTETNSTAIALREELLAQLSRVSIDQLTVLAPNSVDKLVNNGDLTTKSAYQLVGTMRRDPLNLRVDLRLTNQEQQQLWSESFVWSNGAGMLAFQNMVKEVILGVSPILAITPADIATPQIVLSSDYVLLYNDALYLAGQSTPEQTHQAIEKFEQVLASYPYYVPAMVQLAKLYNTLASSDSNDQAANFEKAASYANKAIQQDSESAEAYFVLAYSELYHDWNFAASRASIDKGLSIAPNNGFARSLNAAWFASQALMDEAMNEANLARRLDPLSQTVNADLCWYLNFAGQYAKAERECGAILVIEPQSMWTRLGLVESLLQQQKHQLALAQYASLFNIQTLPDEETSEVTINKIVRQWLTQLLSGYEKGQIQAYMIAALYSQLKDDEQAIHWLQRAYEDNNGFLVFMRVDPRFKSLRHLNSFKSIERKVFENIKITQ